MQQDKSMSTSITFFTFARLAHWACDGWECTRAICWENDECALDGGGRLSAEGIFIETEELQRSWQLCEIKGARKVIGAERYRLNTCR